MERNDHRELGVTVTVILVEYKLCVWVPADPVYLD